ncbi:hypothetical protein R5W23_001704 [Gemmata sp. JC673]|uniref:Uncharacterized protein n=1 Tax=Gemmata algarum TaxID=2975278 RepID=A0ABU5EYS7_9BACT|nr:hypothetical protein [Gemmata algarum]MDY3560470.1 hypothetical protein [Gemmata algarum]
MRALSASLLLLVLVGPIGCKRGLIDRPDTADAGSYARVGPLGLAVESVRHGKVRVRGMMGQEGESKDDVFVIKTRFKLLDTSMPVKQPAIQQDGGIQFSFGENKLRLVDGQGREAKPVAAGGLDAVSARRTGTTVLNAENSEATDLLTFESIPGATGDLTLEVPASYQPMQPNGNYAIQKSPGTFKIRILKDVWDAQPPTVDAGPGRWATVGPVSVSVEAVRLGKVKVRTLHGTGDSSEDLLCVAVRVKLADPAARVKKPPFVPSSIGAPFASPALALRPARGGEPYKALTSFGFGEVLGRQSHDAELSAQQPEVTDLITFEAKAAEADELILTIWPKWKERKPDGTWADTTSEEDFRFRIPKGMWAK